MRTLNNRFGVVLSYFQIKKNIRTSRKYNTQGPSAIHTIIDLVLSIGLYLAIAYTIHKLLMSVSNSIMNNPASEHIIDMDSATNTLLIPNAQIILLIYVISLYMGIRRYNRRIANRSVANFGKYLEIESEMYQAANRILNDDDVDVKEAMSLTSQYNRTYRALITPSNTEIILHKKHIDSLERESRVIQKALDKTVNNYRKKNLPIRQGAISRKLVHHRTAISVNRVQQSIDRFIVIQNAISKINSSHKPVQNTLRFKFYKLTTVQQIRNEFKGV